MRSGRLRVSGPAVRLGGLKQGGTMERRRGPLPMVDPPRRSVRHTDKRVRWVLVQRSMPAHTAHACQRSVRHDDKRMRRVRARRQASGRDCYALPGHCCDARGGHQLRHLCASRRRCWPAPLQAVSLTPCACLPGCRYDEQLLEGKGVTEGWQKDILRRARRGGE